MRRSALLLLALGWGWLVLGVYHKLGYEHATGYPPLAESAAFAIGAALPLLLGVFIADSRAGISKYLRWLSAFWLAAQAAFLLIVSWLKLFGFLPLIGCLLLLWPDIKGPEPANPPRKPVSWRKRVGYALLGITSVSLFVWWGWFHNPLPSDEAMIKHFNEHRAEFEQLVRGYRNYRRTDVFYAKSSEEVEALARKLGVHRIQAGTAGLFPNPYSDKTALIRYNCMKAGTTSGPDGVQKWSDKMAIECWQENMPELFEGMTPIIRSHQIDLLAGVIQFIMGNAHHDFEMSRPAHMGMSKNIWWFPQIVLVENGRILEPPLQLDTKLLPIRAGSQVLESLNYYPPNWKAGDCFFRRIDSHWFIVMCKAAY